MSGSSGRGTLSIDRKKGGSSTTVRQKVDWLLENRDMWMGRKFDDRVIIDAMKEARLFSRSTFWKDVNLTGLLILAAREAGE